MKKEERFNTIIHDNLDRIKRICRYYNSNTHDQEDMLQEIMVNIWKSLESFRGDSSINTWIYRVAINTALSYSGKSYKYMKLMVCSDTAVLSQFLTDNPDAEEVNDEELYERMQNELNMLSVIDKALISLMLEGLSMKEIADVIGITEPNVKVKIHRIKEQLRSRLNQNNNETI